VTTFPPLRPNPLPRHHPARPPPLPRGRRHRGLQARSVHGQGAHAGGVDCVAGDAGGGTHTMTPTAARAPVPCVYPLRAVWVAPGWRGVGVLRRSTP
jgi:hypothetical protein